VGEAIASLTGDFFVGKSTLLAMTCSGILHENRIYATIAQLIPSELNMIILSNIVIAIVAILHLGFLVLEMFLWNHPIGQKTFKMTKEVSESSATLAANQGLYNGFLAAGLIWGLISGQFAVKLFFLVCVLIAGIFGGLTAKRSILYIQALPAVLGLLLLYLSA
jgi:putative membrane protein